MEKLIVTLILMFAAAQAVANNATTSSKNATQEVMHPEFVGQRLPLPNCGQNSAFFFAGTYEILKNCTRKICFVSNTKRNELPKDQILCPIVCAAQGIGMMNETGKIDRAKFRRFFEMTISNNTGKPAELASMVNACADMHEASISLKPENCTTASPFLRCAFEKVFRSCGYDLNVMESFFNEDCSDYTVAEKGLTFLPAKNTTTNSTTLPRK